MSIVTFSDEQKKKYNANEIILHTENGINFVEIDGTQIRNVSEYRVESLSNGLSKITLTINAQLFASDFEMLVQRPSEED